MESAVDTMGDAQQKATIARLRQLLEERSSGQWHPPTLAGSQGTVPGSLSFLNQREVACGFPQTPVVRFPLLLSLLRARPSVLAHTRCHVFWRRSPVGAPAAADPGPVVPGPPELPVFQSKAGCLANVRCVKTGEVFMLFKEPFRFGTESEGSILFNAGWLAGRLFAAAQVDFGELVWMRLLCARGT